MRLPAIALLAAASSFAQNFTQRGFLENTTYLYPQTAPGDSGQFVNGALLRYEAFYKLVPGFRFTAGVDARTDTHLQVERSLHLDWRDRTAQEPAFAIRRLSASYSRGKLTIEAGKQFIRWGKADILNPTDRFAPQDYLNVLQSDFLPVTAARVTYGPQANTIDAVWCPLFTPSRTPLIGQRWAALPADATVHDQGASFPGGSQFGVRWNHIGQTAEYSVSFFDGYNPLPLIDVSVRSLVPLGVDIRRFYPKLRTYGGDLALPLRWVSLKSEAAYFTSPDTRADQYVLYVIQLERQAGEWFFVGGYAGEYVAEKRSLLDFAPDRGLTKAFVGRAGYTIDTNRSVALESVARQNGDGLWLRFEYSQALGQHWRVTAGASLIRGASGDFLGQYQRNSHVFVTLRYSF